MRKEEISKCAQCGAEVMTLEFHGHDKIVDARSVQGLTMIADAYGEPLGTEIATVFPLHSESCASTRAEGDTHDEAAILAGKSIRERRTLFAKDDSEVNPDTATEWPPAYDPVDRVVVVCYDKNDNVIGRIHESGTRTGTTEGEAVVRRDSLNRELDRKQTKDKPSKKGRQ